VFALPYLIFRKLHQLAIDARRASRTSKYLAHSALAALAVVVMLVAGIGLTTWLVIWGLWYVAIGTLLFMIAPPIAHLAIRHVAVPLGLVRVAHYLGAVFAHATGKDADAYGYAVGAWALSCKPSPGGEAWLARHREARTPLGDAEVVVTAMIATARGDADNARLLLRSITMLVEDHPAVRELAGEWLAVDAAARGAWSELHADATAATFPATPLTFFLEGCAARHASAEGAPGDTELWGRWIMAPHRRATRPLLDAARAATADRPPSEASPTSGTTAEPADPGASLPAAIAAHLALGGDPAAATRDQLADAVAAWDGALEDAATRAWIAHRAALLEAPLGSADRALRDVAAAVVDELAAIAEVARLGAPPSTGELGPVGEGLARRLRHGRLDALEDAFTRWADRRTVKTDTPRSGIDEWREFVALHAAHGAAVSAGGLELRRLAFPKTFTNGNSMAAWLWNERNEYAISHAISRWLLDEALAVGDTEAIELGYRNCALEIPTRLGRLRQSPRQA